MTEDTAGEELTPEGRSAIEAVDGYLERSIREGRPIEALVATRRLGEVVGHRATEAARAATEGSWSWTDVGRALGVSKQAAHEKLRARVHDRIERELSKLERSEQAGHEKIARQARRGREALDRHPLPTPKVQSAGERIDEWERRQHEKLAQDMRKAREHIGRAERAAQEKLDRKGQAGRRRSGP